MRQCWPNSSSADNGSFAFGSVATGLRLLWTRFRRAGWLRAIFAVRLVARTARDSHLERFDFPFCKWSHGACRQVAETNRSDGDAFEPLHFVTDAGEQAADLAIAAFVEHHFQDRRLFATALDTDVFHVGEAFGQVDAAVELFQDFVLDLTSNLDVINLFDAVARMREAVSEFAVVRDNDQTFRSHVEAADTKDPRRIWRQQIGNSCPAGRIASGCHDTDRLVYGEVSKFWSQQGFAVDADLLLERIDSSPQLGHDLMIDFDSPLADQFFAFAAAGNTRECENLLQSIAGLRRRGVAVIICAPRLCGANTALRVMFRWTTALRLAARGHGGTNTIRSKT
jgi:hypothetical protein